MSEYKMYNFFFFSADKPLEIKKVSIAVKDTIARITGSNLEKCNDACIQYLGCNSYKYNDNDKLCDLSNITQLTGELKPGDGNWDVHIITPGL